MNVALYKTLQPTPERSLALSIVRFPGGAAEIGMCKDGNLTKVGNFCYKTKKASWIVSGMLLSSYSIKIHAYMGNFGSTFDWILFFAGALVVILLVGLVPAFLIFQRHKKRRVFLLTPILGILVLLLVYGFLSMIGSKI